MSTRSCRFRQAGALLLLIATLMPAWGGPSSKSPQTGRVVAPQLNVRADANAKSKKLATLPRDAIVEITGRRGAFLEIRHGSTRGFVAARFVQIRNEQAKEQRPPRRTWIKDATAKLADYAASAWTWIIGLIAILPIRAALISLATTALLKFAWAKLKTRLPSGFYKAWIVERGRRGAALVLRLVQGTAGVFCLYCLVIGAMIAVVAIALELFIRPALPQALLLAMILVVGAILYWRKK